MYNFQGGANLREHGALNSAVLLFLIASVVFLYGVIKLIIKIYKKGKIAVFVIGSIVIFASFFIYFVFLKDSCKDWKIGLNGKVMEDLDGTCKVLMPNYCELTYRNGLYDFTNYSQKCSEFTTSFQMEMLNDNLRYKPNLKRLGFPRTEFINPEIQVNQSKIRKYVGDNMIDMDDPLIPQSIKDNIEFVVDISDPNNHHLYIDVKRNSTRVEELKKIREKVLEEDRVNNNTERIDKNLILLYFDNLSRQHFHRKMNKFASFLSELSGKEESEYDVFEFMRFHSVASYTYPNQAALFYGSSRTAKSESRNVYQYFSQNGFITATIYDIWVIIEWKIENVTSDVPFYSFDHAVFSFNWDYNHDGKDEPLSIFGGINSYLNRWLYGYNLFDIQFEYTSQIWEKYPDVRKFVRLDSNYNHEWTGELIRTSDEAYEKFFRDFQSKGYLKDTDIIIVADHGGHFVISHTPIFPDDSRFQENYFPVLFIISHKDTPKKNLDFLKNNQQQFMNSFDIYTTLKSFANRKISKNDDIKSFSVYHEELPKGRECVDGDGIVYSQCYCRNNISELYELRNKHGYFYIEF